MALRSWLLLGLVVMDAFAVVVEAASTSTDADADVARVGDEGVYVDRATGEEEFAFAWLPAVATQDRWGFDVDAAILRTLAPAAPDDRDVPAGVRVESREAFGGASADWVWRQSVRNTTSRGVQPLGLPVVERPQTWQEDAEVTDYAVPPLVRSCLAHHGLQGRALGAGEVVTLADFCPPAGDLRFQAAPEPARATTFLGRPALELRYALGGDGGLAQDPSDLQLPSVGTLTVVVAQAWPFVASAEAATADGVAWSYVLRGFGRGTGAEVPPWRHERGLEPFPDPSSRFTPLTRDGPEDGGAGLPYKLEDALASLRGDATLLDFQTWRRAHPDAYVQYAWVGLAEGMQGDVAEWHVELAVPVSETDADVYMLASRQEQMPTGLFGYAADRVTNSDDGHGIGTYGQRAPATGEQAMDFRTAIALWLARAPEPYASMPVSEVGYLAPTLDGPAAIYALSGSSRASLVDGVRSDRAGLLLDAATGAALQSVRRGTDIRYGAITVNPDPLDSLTAHQDQRTFLAGTPVEPPLLIGAALTAAALLALLAHGGFLAVMYSRLRSSNLLATPVRRRIYDLVDQHPGIHFQGVAGAIGIGIGATMYHLSVLRRGGLITRVDLRGYSRYYLSGSVPPRALQRVAELEAGSARAVYEAVRARPGITLGEVARQVNVSPPAAHKTVERLQQAGLVEKKVEGRRVRLTAREVGMEN